MSSAVDPSSIRRDAQKREVVEAIRESEFADVGSRGVAEETGLPHGRVRKLVQELREEDEIYVTRTVGPAKLYRVTEDDE